MSCEPSKTFPDNFWLSPEGNAYACMAYEHCELADKLCLELHARDTLNGEAILEKLGWLKRSLGDFIYLAHDLIRVGGPTQAQIDYIFDWYINHGKPLDTDYADLLDLKNRN